MIDSNRFGSPKIGDIFFDEKSGRRKRYNGVQWHALCRVDGCPLASTFNELCAQHRCENFNKNTNCFSSSDSKLIERKVTQKKRCFDVEQRYSREMKTIIEGQNFLCNQNEKTTKHPIENQITSPRKRARTSADVEKMIERIENETKILNERVDKIIQIRNLFF